MRPQIQTTPARSAALPASVLMQSARSRITLAAGLTGLLWLAVMWALG